MQVLYSMCFSSLWGAVIDIDQQLFLFLNGLHGTWLDPVMKFITGIPQWIPLYLLIIFFLFRKRDWRVGLLALLGVLLTFGITDQVGNLIKSAVQRPRPCLEFEGLIHILTGCGGRYASFISNHAANTFGLAMFTSLFFKKRSYSVFIFTWAAVVSYSRIYVGKHYPLDILAGALVGMLAGYLVYRLFAFINRRSRFKMQDARYL